MSVEEWLGEAPTEVTKTTERLLAEVASMREDGQTIYPPQDDILNALAWTAPGDVRAVILGQDPYHEEGQAMGLSFSVHEGCRLPPSLRNIYKEMAADLGCDIPASGDLSGWARQGVLLLNTTLTVRQGAANSHAKLGWQVLTHHIVRRCLALPQPANRAGGGLPAFMGSRPFSQANALLVKHGAKPIDWKATSWNS